MESSVIHHMVDSIINNQQTDAMEKFNEIMATKITDALDAKKIVLRRLRAKTKRPSSQKTLNKNSLTVHSFIAR